MSTASLPRPGVSVIQVFTSVTPTVITPTLVPTVVGVCKQVVDVLTTTATGGQTLNSEALTPLPAFFIAAAATGTPPVYAGLDGLKLVLSLNNGPPLDITFSGSPLSPAQIVAQVLLVFSAQGITGFTAEVVGTTQWRLRSVATDQFQSIKVLGTGSDVSAPEVLAAFGLGPDKEYIGTPTYNQDIISIPLINFPNPNNNISQLEFDPTTERAFLYFGGPNLSSALMELLQTQSFLSNGIATAAVLNGTVDLTTLTLATAAAVTGSADITAGSLYGGGGSLNGETIILNVNGAGPLTLTLSGTGNAASEAALLAAIEAEWPGITAVQGGGGGNKLVLTDLTAGTSGTITVGSGTANTNLGLTPGTSTGTNGTLDGQGLVLAFNGGSNLTTTFVSATTIAGYLAQLNAIIGTVATAIEGATAPHHLQISTIQLGALASASVISGSATTTLGLAVQTVVGVSAVQAIDSGSGSGLTSLLAFPGQNFTTSPSSAQVTGTVGLTSVTDGNTLILDDGTGPQTLTFEGASSSSLILSQINALFGAAAGGFILATVNGSTQLVLTNIKLGVESIIKVLGGTALTQLGITAASGTTTRGTPYVPLPGDLLYVDGQQYATISQVAPGGNVTQLKINKQVPISNNVGLSFYIVATNLNAESAASGVTRPTPNLTLDGVGNMLLKPDLIRNTQGTPIATATAQMYLAYHAIRLDVTALATNPGLLRFSDTPTLETQLAPVTTNNPLALGLYLALLNAPGIQVTGLGVDATSGAEPDGTVDAFTRAFTFLESYEVYAIAPLTHEDAVFQIAATHVTFMSEPDNKGERIVLINEPVPTHKLDTLVASGTNGNTNLTVNQFDTGVSNLGTLLAANGLSGVGPYTTANGIYLDDGDGNKYNIINIVGSVVTLKTSGFLPGENDDGYYATTTLPTPLISQTWAVRIRGAALLLPDGTPDNDNKALTVQQTAQGFANRRVWYVFPDSCAATINGVEQVIDGFYMSAAICGLIAAQPPQQSFTNFPMTGFTRVIGSNDTFSNPQLDVIAAGGTYIIVQDAPSTPLISRMALTTDMSSIETRTDSITKIVDFTAKFLRSGLRNFIGRFNITQGFLDSLGHVIQGLLGFLTESGVLIGAQLNNIIQDTSAPDTVLVDIVLDVPFPCNYIRLTLTV
jgi:hypothetical protein